MNNLPVRLWVGSLQAQVFVVYPNRNLNRPGIAGGHVVRLCCHGFFVQHGIVALFSLGRRDSAGGLKQAAVVVPVYRFERCIFTCFK